MACLNGKRCSGNNYCVTFLNGQCRHPRRHCCFESVKYSQKQTKKIAKESHDFNSLTKNQQQELWPF